VDRARRFITSPSSETPAQIAGLKAWFDARSDQWFTFSTGAQISAWTSRAGSMGPVTFAQVTGASQPLRALAVATFNGKNTVQFDGVNDQLVSSVTNEWKFLHDGTGFSSFTVSRIDSTGGATQQVFLNSALATEVGINASFVNNPFVSLRWRNGSGSNLNAYDPAGTAQRDVTSWGSVSYIDGTITYARSGAATTNADVAGQDPSTANPARPLYLGATATPTTNPFKGHIATVMFFDHVLTAEERGLLAAWAAQEYGLAALSGTSGFGVLNYYETSNAMQGDASGFWQAALFKVDSQAVIGVNRNLIRHVGVGGARLRISGTNTTLRFAATDDFGSLETSSSYTITPADLGRVLLAVAVHDGVSLRLYVNRVEVTPAIPITGYMMPPTAEQRIGDGADGLTIFGVAQGNAVPTLSDIESYYDAIKAERRMAPMPGVQTDHLWNTTQAGPIPDELAGSSADLFVAGGLSTVAQEAEWSW
jgi:hypothetical protein